MQEHDGKVRQYCFGFYFDEHQLYHMHRLATLDHFGVFGWMYSRTYFEIC